MHERDIFQPPQIAQVGTIDLGTPDLETSLKFFRDLLGMEVTHQTEGQAYLRCYQELQHHSLVLTRSDQAVVNSYSFRVQRPEDVERFALRLEQQDVEYLELPDGHEAGRGAAIRFVWPHGGHPLELYYDIEKPVADEAIRSLLPSNSSTRRGLGARRIDHYNLQTSADKVTAAEKWLRETLGFKRREYIARGDSPTEINSSWLSTTSQVHDIAVGANVDDLSGRMHHVAFNIENFHDMLTAADVMRDLKVTIDGGPGKHGLAQAMYLYVRDPGSGHRVELYSGGYHIFEPDWEPIRWEEHEFLANGATWHGDPVKILPGEPMAPTTASASLHETSLLHV